MKKGWITVEDINKATDVGEVIGNFDIEKYWNKIEIMSGEDIEAHISDTANAMRKKFGELAVEQFVNYLADNK